MVAYFDSDEIAAVAGNVKVGNRKNLLTRWQSIEYITSQNFDRRAYDVVNAIMVVPGAIGAFRRDAVQKVGMFTIDTLAEDCDLTLRLLNAGYKVRTCNEALAFTEVPETLHMLLKQRFPLDISESCSRSGNTVEICLSVGIRIWAGLFYQIC